VNASSIDPTISSTTLLVKRWSNNRAKIS